MWQFTGKENKIYIYKKKPNQCNTHKRGDNFTCSSHLNWREREKERERELFIKGEITSPVHQPDWIDSEREWDDQNDSKRGNNFTCSSQSDSR